MSLDWTRFFSLIGTISIFVVLILMGLLSKRLGIVTRTRPYYRGFYVAALLMGISILVRMMNRQTEVNAQARQDVTTILFYGVFPALSLTLGVIIAWRYWSWLFAERN
jgi:hypothetical protein